MDPPFFEPQIVDEGHLGGHRASGGRASGRMSGAIETVHEPSLKAASSLFCESAPVAAIEGPQVGLQIRKLQKKALREVVLDL